MQIWIDADACPNISKDILFRVAQRKQIITVLVANQMLAIPSSIYIKRLQVPKGYDVADNEIVRQLTAGDLVITGDIALAYEVLEKGGYALNPRGELYSKETIKERLTMRDFMETLRASGIHSTGNAPLSNRDSQLFANQLDKLLAKLVK